MSQCLTKTESQLPKTGLETHQRGSRISCAAITRAAPPPAVDLNKLRAVIVANRQGGNPQPADLARSIVVGGDGRLHLGANGPCGAGAHLSEIQQAVFSATVLRAVQEEVVARSKMPPGTHAVAAGKVRGWLYDIWTELADHFQLFAYFDGCSYQVQVVSPKVEGSADPHRSHLLPDGRICLSSDFGAGMPSLESAFAKSVLWANGFSVFQRTGEFPF